MQFDEDLKETVADPGASSLVSPKAPRSFAGGRYQVQRLLGRGGQKDVYLARDTSLKRDVALSLLKTEWLDKTSLLRLHKEAQAMARLGDNPYIVAVYDIGEEEGQPYIVSQYIEGGSVADLLRRTESRPLPLDQVLRIGIQIAAALAHSHERGIIHCDVKPGNVWLSQDGIAKLGDFGLALSRDLSRVTAAGTWRGTAGYIAPELLVGSEAGPATDLYSLGVMLYEMTTGRLPFQGDQPLGIAWQHLNTAPVAPSWHCPQVPQALETLILRLMSKAPLDRPARADAVRKALEMIASTTVDQIELPVVQDSRSLARLAGGVFVGREQEMRALRSGLEEAKAGHGRLFLLFGEPGCGKTRTAEQLATHARLRGAEVLIGRCYEGEGAPAFWPWVQIIRSYIQDKNPEELRSIMGPGAADLGQIVPDILRTLPDLPPPPTLEPEQARFRLFDSITTFLKKAGRAQPLVAILDDLHWADRPSLLVLQFLARELRNARVLVLGTYRDLALMPQHPLSQSLGELAREGLSHRIVLSGLSEMDVARFMQMTTGVEPPRGLVSAVYQQTDGNPFFVNEVVRLLVAEGQLQRPDEAAAKSIRIPEGVREVIRRRLDHLSEPCSRILSIASVVGREFNLEVLAPLSHRSADSLLELMEEAVAARLIAEKPQSVGTFTFSHALIRETLYEGLSATRRVRLHRRIGAVLEKFYRKVLDPHLAELAYHFFQAAPGGDIEKAVHYAVAAAERATRLLAYEEAVDHYKRALEAIELREVIEKERHCDLMLRLGEAQTKAGYPAAARETFQRAASSARERGHAEQLARAALGLGGAVGTSYGGVDQPQVDLLREALSAVTASDNPLRARLLARLSLALYYSAEQRVLISQEAVASARRLGDRAAQLAAVYSRCVCLEGFAKGDERLALATELVEVAEEVGDKEMVLRGRYHRFREFLELGEIAAADQEIKSYSELAEELRQPLYQWLAAFARATRAVMEGRFDEGERLAQESVAIGKRADERNTILFLESLTSVIRKLQGRHEELATRNKELVEKYPHIPTWRASLAQIWIKLDRLQEARAELERLAPSDFAAMTRDGAWSTGFANLAEVCAALEDGDRAQTLYRILEPFAGRNVVIGNTAMFYGPVSHSLGLLASTMALWDTAAKHFEEALDMNAKLRARPFEAQSQCAYAVMLLKRDLSGDRQTASSLLERSLATAEELGMQRVSHDARTLRHIATFTS